MEVSRRAHHRLATSVKMRRSMSHRTEKDGNDFHPVREGTMDSSWAFTSDMGTFSISYLYIRRLNT